MANHMQPLRIRIKTTATIVGCLVVVCVSLVQAQEWSAPLQAPPFNNPNQPPAPTDLSDYVQKSVTTLQTVNDVVFFSHGVTGFEARFGEPGVRTNPTINGVALFAGDDIPAQPNLPTAVYAYGQSNGFFGYAANPTNLNVGVMGYHHGGLTAGRFTGPVRVLNDGVSGALGDVIMSSTMTVGEVECNEDDGCAPSTNNTLYWLRGESSTLGTTNIGVRAEHTTLPALEIKLSNGSKALYGISDVSYGLGGYSTSTVGIKGIIKGASGPTYYGVAGYTTANSNNLASIGLYGQTLGGTGSADGDMAAGIRACVENGSTVANQRGIEGTGDRWAGYFVAPSGQTSGKILLTRDEAAGRSHRLQVGNVYLTEQNVKGIFCAVCRQNPTFYADLCTRGGGTSYCLNP